MGDMINCRTAEAIKDKILWCCSAMCCGECKYDADGDFCSSDTVLKDALALIERLEAERDAALAKMPRWISVKERLPKNGNLVLVTMSGETRGNKMFNHAYELACYYRDGEDEEGVYRLDGWELWDYRDGEVLNLEVFCWMPLPEPPKEDAHETE